MAANTPVKKIVAPIPIYLLTSVGVLLRIDWLAPEQKRKKFLRDCMCEFSWLSKNEMPIVIVSAAMKIYWRFGCIDYYSTSDNYFSVKGSTFLILMIKERKYWGWGWAGHILEHKRTLDFLASLKLNFGIKDEDMLPVPEGIGIALAPSRFNLPSSLESICTDRTHLSVYDTGWTYCPKIRFGLIRTRC